MKTLSRPLGYAIALALLLLAAQPVLADGIIIIDPPIPIPPPNWEPWLTITYHRVTVTIKDQVAITQVDQGFRNDGAVAVEGSYVFPLPPGAAVDRFTLWIDGKPVDAQVLGAEEARHIYEDYVARQRDPALLEYVGRDAVQARIFPIQPGEERRIQLEYTQVLEAEDDLMYYRYPLNTERFSSRPLQQVSIAVQIETQSELRALYSPSHQDVIAISREDARHAQVSFEASDVLPDRDFELYIGTSEDHVGASLVTYAPPQEDGFFLLILSPGHDQGERPIVARDILLVVDVSGSMEGEKLQQAKDGVAYVLRHLNPNDRFNVIAFSSQTRSFADRHVGQERTAEATDWVAGLQALGGTNIYMGLTGALQQASADRPTTVIFLTDGLPTEGIVDEQSLLSSLAEEAPGACRIFPFGVGYDVNTLLLDQMAQEHGGRSAYIRPEEAVDEVISGFYAKIQSPILTDVALEVEGVRVYDVLPEPLPDLYAGSQLIVTGRFSGSGTGRTTVSGAVDGEPYRQSYEHSWSPTEGAEFVPRLWATRTIGHLLTQIRLHGENKEWIDAIVTLSLRYGIITPYTSFLVEEPSSALSTEGRADAVEEFSRQLEAAPQAASGKEAVDDAVMRETLGAAQAPAAEGYSYSEGAEGESAHGVVIRYAGDKAFFCGDGVCTDTAYVPETMETVKVEFLSDEYRSLLAAHPEWAPYLGLDERTIFVGADGQAYAFALGEGEQTAPEDEAEVIPEATEAATPEATPEPEPGNGPSRPTALCPGTLAIVAMGLVVGTWQAASRREGDQRGSRGGGQSRR